MITEYVDVENVQSFVKLGEKRKGVHAGLWVFWIAIGIITGLLLITVAVTALFHYTSPKLYKVALKLSDGSTVKIWVNAETYEDLKLSGKRVINFK